MKVQMFLLALCLSVLTALEAATMNEPRTIENRLGCDKLNLIMVLDKTKSIGPKLFEKMKSLSKQVIDRFFVSHNQTRLGLVVFGKHAQMSINLARWKAGRQHLVEQVIDRIPAVLDNITNLHEALQVVFNAHNNFDKFEIRKKIRTDAQKVVIIITDGKTQDRKSLKSLMKTKPEDVTVIAVALGRKARKRRNRKTLKIIADDVITWTQRNRKLRNESEVLEDIMANFDFKPCESRIPVYPSVEKFGCYSKTTPWDADAMNSMENDKCWLMVNESTKRDQAFEKCAWLAWKRGYNTFGVDGKKQCSSGFIATRFYKGGSKNNCQDKLGGSDSNIVFYFKAIAPRVQYGSIVCLQSWHPVMPSIPKEEVDRMPGKTTAEKCAWAARTRQHFLFAVKTKSEECTSSKFTYPQQPPTVLNNLAQKSCSGRNGERVLYFAGAGAACKTRGDRDIAIVADLEKQNIHFLVTLVDTLDVDVDGHHVGLINTESADIKVKFSDQASQNETALLEEVRGGAMTASGKNYKQTLMNVQQIFAPGKGEREEAKNVLLVFSDATEAFTRHSSSAVTFANSLKKNGVIVVVVGFGNDVKPETEEVMKSVATNGAATIIDTNYPRKAAAVYYRNSLNTILNQICQKP